MQDLFTNVEKSFGPPPRHQRRKWGIAALCIGLALSVIGAILVWPSVTQAANNVKSAWSDNPAGEELETTQAVAPAIGPEVSGDMQLSELDASLQDPLDGGAASPCKNGEQMWAFVDAEIKRLGLSQVKVTGDKSATCAMATLNAASSNVSISANPTEALPYADRLDTPMIDGLLTLTTECLTGTGVKGRVEAELAKNSETDSTQNTDSTQSPDGDAKPAVKVLETSVGKCARIDMAGDGSPEATVWLPTGG